MWQEGSRVRRTGKAQLLPRIRGHQGGHHLHGVQDEGCHELVGVAGGLGMIRVRNIPRSEGQLWNKHDSPLFFIAF